MGTVYNCACNGCGQLFQLQEGGGFRFVQWMCDGCGRSISLPRFAPRRDRRGRSIPSFLRRHGDTEWPPIAESEIVRFVTEDDLAAFLSSPRDWPDGGDQWDQYEIDAMLKIIGECSCGGNWENPHSSKFHVKISSIMPHPLSRCPNCRSFDFLSEQSAIYD